MRRSAVRLVWLLAALALVLAPVAARAHRYAGAAVGLDLCTTPVDGKSPVGAAHADHCECCTSAPAAPPPRGTPSFAIHASHARGEAVDAAPRVFPVDAPPARAPPCSSFSSL